jgi:DNA replication protein DnaC
VWLETVANVRLHRETQRRLVDLWAEERADLQPVNPRLIDVGRVLQHYPALMEQAARESWTHGRLLEQLMAGEAARRDAALVTRRVKAARLPGIKTQDGFDWSWPKKINRAQVQQLFRLEFLPRHGNVILLGGVGVGKSHLAIALAQTACLQGRTTLFTSAVDIVNALAAAQATGGLKREMARLQNPRCS